MINTDDSGNHSIRWGKNKINLATMALILMLAGILLPSAFHAYKMKDVSDPTQLLISICVSLFASVIYLWILDATSVLRFRNEWVSKSIYGAAIVSVLGTTVGVYKDFFTKDKYPYEGIWNITLSTPGHKIIAENELNLGYSLNSKCYFGYSDLNVSALKDTAQSILAVHLKALSIENNEISLICYNRNGTKIIFNKEKANNIKGNHISVQLDSMVSLDLVRPN